MGVLKLDYLDDKNVGGEKNSFLFCKLGGCLKNSFTSHECLYCPFLTTVWGEELGSVIRNIDKLGVVTSKE